MSAKLILFVLLALMMSGTAIILAILPLFRKVVTREASKQDVNLQVLRDQLSELEADLIAGTLSQAQFDEAKQDIARRLLEELPQGQEVAIHKDGIQTLKPDSVAAKASHRLAIGLSLSVPFISLVLYSLLGNPFSLMQDEGMSSGEARAQQQNEAANKSITPEKVQLMIQEIKTHLVQAPNDARAWAILARAYHFLGDFPEAVKTYQHALPMNPGDSDLQADYQTALEMLKQSKLSNAPKQNDAALTSKSIRGRVAISAALKSQVHPEDSVFIFAKAESGPPMPLAVMRLKVKDLPAEFTLDDSMAMMPQLKLSGFPKVVVGARVSQTGNAIPSSGDLQGLVKGVAPGSQGLNIEISERLP